MMKCFHGSNYLRLSNYDDNIRKIDDFGKISEDNFLEYLEHLGGIFNVLECFNSGDYNKDEAVNITDCNITANNIWKLFNPKVLDTIVFDEHELIYEQFFNSDANIFIIGIGGGLPYHKFIIIRTIETYMILNAYAGEYSLKLFEIPNPAEQLNNLLKGSSDEFNNLFRTNEARFDRSSTLRIRTGIFKSAPVDKLFSWIDDYRNNFSI